MASRGLTIGRQAHGRQHHHHHHHDHHRHSRHHQEGDLEGGRFSAVGDAIELGEEILQRVSTRNSSASNPLSQSAENVSPLHDKNGKPIKRTAHETFGEAILHPIKELELHRKRQHEFEEERKVWEEKHHQIDGMEKSLAAAPEKLAEEE